MSSILYAQTLQPAEPWSPGTHGNGLRRLAPGLRLSNAWRPQPPDVTFPADTEKKYFYSLFYVLFDFFFHLSLCHPAFSVFIFNFYLIYPTDSLTSSCVQV